MRVLGIETTCDETACAVVEDGQRILSNVVSSQINLHAEYGGVVPELSCRRHVDVLIPVIKEALETAEVCLSQIDLIAVSYGPGLIGAILIGLTAAKSLSICTGIPFLGINHVEAHLYSGLMEYKEKVEFPCLGVVVSGGHTNLLKIDEIGKYHSLGQTVDDALGETFDKVGKMLGIPYPAGPLIEKLATEGDPQAYPFKAGKVKSNRFDFSFSGLKTAVLYTLRGQDRKYTEQDISHKQRVDVAASFQKAAFDDLFTKTIHAAGLHDCKYILFGGGVVVNQALRKMFLEKSKDKVCLWPSKELSLDNAAMIAGLAYHKFLQQGRGDELSLEAATSIPLGMDTEHKK